MRVLSFLGAVGIGVFAGTWLRELRRMRLAAVQPININEASKQEMVRRLRLDPELAERIVEHRPYPSKIDLLGRMVVSEEIYNSIKSRITHKAS